MGEFGSNLPSFITPLNDTNGILIAPSILDRDAQYTIDVFISDFRDGSVYQMSIIVLPKSTNKVPIVEEEEEE